MSFRLVRIVVLSLVFLLMILPFGGTSSAQSPTGGLSGVVTDPSGSVIAKVAVRLTAAGGASLDTTTNRDGFYEFKGLAPGVFILKAGAKGFCLYTKDDVRLLARQTQKMNIWLVFLL